MSDTEQRQRVKPQRIQRKRTKGWRMPEGAVYVGRPTLWGNPYSGWFQRFKHFDVAHSLRLYEDTVLGCWSPALTESLPPHVQTMVYEYHCAWRNRFPANGSSVECGLSYLRGRDLACWCLLDEPCHADILLELANR